MLFLMMVLNFVISWMNAKSVGRVWSEAKAAGGSFKMYTMAGYVMAIAGFTMVYGVLLLLALPVLLPMFVEGISPEDVAFVSVVANDMLYVLVVTAIIPSGFLIWYRSVVNAWKQRTMGNVLVAGWNTFAMIRNTAGAIRHMPSVLGRLSESLTKGRRDGKGGLVIIIVLVVAAAILGGYFTAAAIVKKADKEYDAFAEMEKELKASGKLAGQHA